MENSLLIRKITELTNRIKELENRIGTLEERTAFIESICQKILNSYGADDVIGEEDINRYFEDLWPDKYAPHYTAEDVIAVHHRMPKLINVCEGYYFEEDPDDMMNDPRWDE